MPVSSGSAHFHSQARPGPTTGIPEQTAPAQTSCGVMRASPTVPVQILIHAFCPTNLALLGHVLSHGRHLYLFLLFPQTLSWPHGHRPGSWCGCARRQLVPPTLTLSHTLMNSAPSPKSHSDSSKMCFHVVTPSLSFPMALRSLSVKSKVPEVV